jgi:hypothetical protein
MDGRKTYSRPQAMIWADAPPTLSQDGKIVPVGYEINSNVSGLSAEDLKDRFLIVSDHNRQPLEMSTQRIEQRQRMANGTMRSYHIADKRTMSTSWEMIPSRSFLVSANFNQETGKPSSLVTEIDHDENSTTPNKKVSPYGSAYYKDQQYTADGGAGGVEMLDWYENHKGPFWVLLSYDNYSSFDNDESEGNKTNEYSEALQMYLSDFQFSVVKRGGQRFDLWNISITLEEV